MLLALKYSEILWPIYWCSNFSWVHYISVFIRKQDSSDRPIPFRNDPYRRYANFCVSREQSILQRFLYRLSGPFVLPLLRVFPNAIFSLMLCTGYILIIIASLIASLCLPLISMSLLLHLLSIQFMGCVWWCALWCPLRVIPFLIHTTNLKL